MARLLFKGVRHLCPSVYLSLGDGGKRFRCCGVKVLVAVRKFKMCGGKKMSRRGNCASGETGMERRVEGWGWRGGWRGGGRGAGVEVSEGKSRESFHTQEMQHSAAMSA